MENINNENLILVNIKLFTFENIPYFNTITNHTDCELLYKYKDDDDYIYYFFKFTDLNNEGFIEYTLDKILEDFNIRYCIQIYEINKKYPRTIRINKNKKKIITKSQTKILSI